MPGSSEHNITSIRMRHYSGDYVITDRGGIIENRYSVHAAIVDSNGKLLFSVGDPTRMTLHRSSAKPAQALAILETPDFDKFGFDDADVAQMCASHSGEDRHIDRVRSMMHKIDIDESSFRCGGHPALNESVNRRWIKADYIPTPICNNCSGKHAGMMGGAKALGADVAGYHLPAHPMQLQVRRVVQDLSGLYGEDDLRWGIDGCNLPAPASALHILAKTFVFFANAADATSSQQSELSSLRTRAASRIFTSMAAYPELVGGEGRFCTELMNAFQGELIGKVGADGCYGIGVRASNDTRRLGSDGAIGIAVKVEDGNLNILYSAVMEILGQLNIGTVAIRERLAHFHKQDILNTAGVVTGYVSHKLRLRSAATEQG